MNLIEEWKHGWKLFSVQANVLGATLMGAYSQLPDELKAVVPSKYVLALAGIVFLAGALGRLVHQPDALPKSEEPK